MRDIFILCPSRGRPERFVQMALSALATTRSTERLTFVLGLDWDDPDRGAYLDAIRRAGFGCAVVYDEMHKGVPAWLELLHDQAVIGPDVMPEAGDLFMTGCDDVLFRTPGWDVLLDQAFDQWPDGLGICYTNDGRYRDKCEHWICTRRWAEVLGYMAWPEFEHFCADQWMEEVAKRIGRCRFLREVVTEHMHFKYGKAPRDATYDAKRGKGRDGRSMSDRDNALYAALASERDRAVEKLAAAMRVVEVAA